MSAHPDSTSHSGPDAPPEAVAVTPLPGAGIVIRTPEFVCVVRADASAGFVAAALDVDAWPGLPERPVPARSGRGRDLARAFADLVTGSAVGHAPDDVAFAAPDPAGVAIYLRGAVFAEQDGHRLSPIGDEPRVQALAWPSVGIGLYLAGVDPALADDARLRLVEGVIPAAGALLHTPASIPGTEILPALGNRTPFTHTPLGGPLASEHVDPPLARTPLPREGRRRPAIDVVQAVDRRRIVRGIRCSRGHLNHPESWLCGVCGIRMDQLTTVMVEGERPPLGWLLFDNGATHLVDDDLVIGREPSPGQGGDLRSARMLALQDDSGQLSRRHLEVRLVEWTVQLVDLGSANGTFVADPGLGNREIRLVPHRPQVLTPGSNVRLASRSFLFESPHART